MARRRERCPYYSDGEGKCLADDEELPRVCLDELDVYVEPVEGYDDPDAWECAGCPWNTPDGCTFDAPCPAVEVR